MNLLIVEIRRALKRRLVWWLIATAVVGCVVLGVVAFFDSSGKSLTDLRANGSHPAVMADWWIAGSGDGILVIGAIPLLFAGLAAGASMTGAEWKAGTVTTMLTWEPRRRRVQAARVGASFVLAVVIAVVLQAIFLSATLPAVLSNGTTAGTDGVWWLGLVGAVGRLGLLTGLAAALGASIATLGRNTAFGVFAAYGWLAIGENLVRGLKPAFSRHLLGENLAIVLTWAPLEDADFSRSAVVSGATLVAYTALVVVAAAEMFSRRDVAGT